MIQVKEQMLLVTLLETMFIGRIKISFFMDKTNTRQNSQIMLSHPHCNSTARFTTFSPDGNSIIVCCEDGTMWRWDRESGGGSRSSKSGKRRRRKT